MNWEQASDVSAFSIGNAVSRITFDFPFCGHGRVRRGKPFRMGGPVLRILRYILLVERRTLLFLVDFKNL